MIIETFYHIKVHMEVNEPNPSTSFYLQRPPINEMIVFDPMTKKLTYSSPNKIKDGKLIPQSGKQKLKMFRAKQMFYNEVPEIELYPLDEEQNVPNPTDSDHPIEYGRQIFLRFRGNDDNTYQWLGHQWFYRFGCKWPSLKDVFDSICWEKNFRIFHENWEAAH